jgi:hypothetical protein
MYLFFGKDKKKKAAGTRQGQIGSLLLSGETALAI